jgi:hypothetical protein
MAGIPLPEFCPILFPFPTLLISTVWKPVREGTKGFRNFGMKRAGVRDEVTLDEIVTRGEWI